MRSRNSIPTVQHSSFPQDRLVLMAPQDQEPANAEPNVCPALPCLLPASLLPTLPKDIVDSQGRGGVFPFGRILQ